MGTNKYKLRYIIKRLPLVQSLYNFLTTVFLPYYSEDGLRAYKNGGFLEQKQFVSAYNKLLNQQPGSQKRWRTHVVLWAAYMASKLEGDFVETGVDKAGLSAAIVDYLDFNNLRNKQFYLFDTYEGIPEKIVGKDEKKAALKNEYSNTYDYVVDSFKGFKNVNIIKGIVPDSLKTVNIDKVSYLSIDMNWAEPERATLEYFWPKLVKGGIIVLDDYAFPGRKLQQESADEFANNVGNKVLCLPTGQGIIIKQ